MFEKWRKKPEAPSSTEFDEIFLTPEDLLLADLPESARPSLYIRSFEGVSVQYDRSVIGRRALEALNRSEEAKRPAGEQPDPEA